MILVTGATGLVGSHLLVLLAENGETIRALFRNEAGIEKTKALFKIYGKEPLFDNIEWLNADITDIPSLEPAFANINKVYHCAALISFDPKDEEKLRKNNIEGTANVVNFCLAFTVKKLCYVSSIAALGDLKEHENSITEETEWNPEKPHSDYAISKFGAEMEIWRGFQEGLEVVIVNPGVILGPSPTLNGWKNSSGEIFCRVANGLPFYTKGTTGFVSVTDVVKVMVLLTDGNFNGQRFIVLAENKSFESIVKKIAEALKIKAPSTEAKRWMTAISWKFDWMLSVFFGKKRSLSKMMAAALHSTEFLSNAKIKEQTGFQFEPIDAVIEKVSRYYPKK